MIILSILITILIGIFLPHIMYKISWPILIKIATQSGDINTLEDLKNVLSISQEKAIEYLITISIICILIFLILTIITKLIKKAITKQYSKDTTITDIKKLNQATKTLYAQKTKLILSILLLITSLIIGIPSYYGFCDNNSSNTFIYGTLIWIALGILILSIVLIIIIANKIKAQKQIIKLLKEKTKNQE